MPIKVYCERNAVRPWLRALQAQGKITLVLFPYDGNNPAGVELATPSVVTMDSTWVRFSMPIPISDMEASPKIDEIRKVLWRRTGEGINEKRVNAPAGFIGMVTEGDARHLDSAYKSRCRAFLTKDKRDILSHADELEQLLGFRPFHPDDDREQFCAFVEAALLAGGSETT